MNDDTQFIVAEISKNWQDGREMQPSGLIARQFEEVIEANRQRGYRLHSFTLHRLLTGPSEMNETIVAVFERVRGPEVLASRKMPGAA
jgi:hypothetical protein